MATNGKSIPEVVEASQFILRSKDGAKKAELSTDKRGEPKLTFFDGAGVARFGVRLEGNSPHIELDNEEGRAIATLGADENGTIALSLHKEDGTVQLMLTVLHSEGGPGIMLMDSNGTPRIFINLLAGANIQISDANGKTTHTIPPKAKRK